MEQQRSKEWFEKRKGKITGSVIGAILECSPYMTPEDVLRQMVRAHHGAESEFEGNVATHYGTFHEEYATEDFELKGFGEIEETGFHVHPQIEWLGASPDGFIGDNVVVEIKCPYGLKDDPKPEFKYIEDMEHYYAQVQYEMFCTGRTETLFYQWTNHGDDLQIVEFNPEYIEETLPILEKFYQLYLSELDNPEHLEPLVQEISDDLAAAEFLKAKDELEEAKERLELAKKQLIQKAGGKKSIISGLKVFKTKKNGSISYKKVVDKHCPDVDLEPFRGKSSEFWTVKE